MKLRASTKIAIGFIVMVVGGIGGSRAYTLMKLRNVELTPIETTDFCLLAIEKDAGVNVLVANRMAQLVELEGAFENAGSSEGGAQGGSIKRRIPVKELLRILDGDGDAINYFINRMKDASEEDLASENAPVWSVEDIKKAFAGDPGLKKKLEYDLNSDLNGNPLPTVNISSFQLGILVSVPVKLSVPNLKGSVINGPKLIPFRVKSMLEFSKRMEQKFYDKNTIQAEYGGFLAELKSSGAKPEDIKSTIDSIEKRAMGSIELKKVERICTYSKVIANKSMVESADFEKIVQNGTTSFTLKLKLSDDAVRRLWKFSSDGGEKLLVVAKGVPIAAAKISSVINTSEVEINQVADERLVQSAIEIFKK
jgi:hypothetical protein